MAYDFTTLLPADFEDLVRDLVGKSVDVRFEAFGPGPDGGIDGRHAGADGNLIIQAKHYAGSSFAQLSSVMRKERKAIDAMEVDRYFLATSRHLSPKNKGTLSGIIGPKLQSQLDIFSRDDLNKLLRDFPEIERAHLKLWLTSSVVLETLLDGIVNAGSHGFTAFVKDELLAKVKVYAHNPSLAEAQKVLDKGHVLIISGPPGVGKTTLAEMMTFAYLSEGWELIALRRLEDGFARIEDSRKQIFYFDDFLGTIALDKRALAAKDSELALFMTRVRKSPNARFILTTRAYILNEAKQSSERLADRKVGLSTYVLDLSAYTRAIRARILYNHLALGGLPIDHVMALLESGALPKVIDHRNYNPRVIEWITDAVRIDEMSPDQYPASILEALENPEALWEKAFRNHITPAARHLLISLFFLGRGDTAINALREPYEALHAHMTVVLGIARDPKDFEESLRHVEGGFVVIQDAAVDFINPSVRDYLASYLTDEPLLISVMSTARTDAFAREVWTFAKERLDWMRLPVIAGSALPVARQMPSDLGNASRHLSGSDGLSLLLEWWSQSGVDEFADIALAMAQDESITLSPWRDGTRLLTLISELHDSGYFEPGHRTSELICVLDDLVTGLFDDYMGSDDLLAMSDLVEGAKCYSSKLRAASHKAIMQEFSKAEEVVSEISSESSLEEHADALRRLATHALVPDSVLSLALSHVDDRLSEVRAASTESSDPDIFEARPPDDDAFSDAALNNLFASLR